MKLIVVTRNGDGKKMYVNADMVCAVYPYYKKKICPSYSFLGLKRIIWWLLKA